MKKRLLALTMAMIMVASTLTACGTTGTESDNQAAPATDAVTEASEAPASEAPASEAPALTEVPTMEAPSTEGWDESKKIYYYSWNDEFGSRMQYVLDAYPEYAEYVEYVNLGVSGTDGTYQTAIDTALTSGDKYPSIIAMDNDVAKYYTENDDVTVALDSVGITNDMYANAYQYTIDYATYNGSLKALTWQATPGCFTYRASIAEEVLGVSEPADVQEFVKDWDTFFTTAETMKTAGYAMISGPDDVKYAIWDQQTQPWVTVAADGSETLTLDGSVTEYFETAKKLFDAGYTDGTSMWSDSWSANFEGDVFGYFGCTWFVYWCIATTEDSETSSYGDWRICAGPVGYHWGGTYVAITKDCPNPELAAFLVYSLCCDEEIMYTLACDTLDFVNNKAVIEREIANGDGASPLLGGQNPVEVWAESAKTIDLSNASYLDSALKAIMDKASEAYNAGTLTSAEEAVQYVKDEVASQYDYITVE
ncbi:MAG TPA: hypothetical protein PLQ04_00725 [Lachnospiraceae bacterium]|nr:hypothetical protein [Lachnospiraceae bacterium]